MNNNLKIIFLISLFIGCAIIPLERQNSTKGIENVVQELNESLGINESITSITFSPDDAELFFTLSKGRWAKDPLRSSIFQKKMEHNKWTESTLSSFSGTFDDSEASIAPNGQALFFISNRPSPLGDTSPNIWKVNKLNSGNWGIPIFVEGVNSPNNEFSPKLIANGNLYFASDREGGFGQGDLYVAQQNGNSYLTPENLGAAINSDKGEWNLCLSSDGKIMLFEASQRPNNFSSFGDLYLSFFENNQWTLPQHLRELNTTGSELNPILIHNDKLLIYVSTGAKENLFAKLVSQDFSLIYQNYVVEK